MTKETIDRIRTKCEEIKDLVYLLDNSTKEEQAKVIGVKNAIDWLYHGYNAADTLADILEREA